MKTPEEIVKFVRTEKDKIWKGLYWRSSNISQQLQNLEKHKKNAIIFLSVETPGRLCQITNTAFHKLQSHINDPVYKQYRIPKKSGGFREIMAPGKELKRIQKSLNYYLQAYYLYIKPAEVNGFVINPRYIKVRCGIVENANAHVNKKYVLNIDLKDFFPSISARKVKELFSSDVFLFNEQIATALTLLTTYSGKLPTGAPTSPVISNFLCLKLDRELIEFCASNELTYTRYADDLTFSTNNFIKTDTILDILNIIKQNNFVFNERKIRLRSSNKKQTVTGLTVNEKVNVDRKLLKKIRAMLHDLTMNGMEQAARRHLNIVGDIKPADIKVFNYRLEGYINFVGQVRGKDDPLYIKLKREFNKSFFLK